MDIREAIIRATRELFEPGRASLSVNQQVVDSFVQSAIALTATDILGGVQHDVLAAVLSAMDEDKPYIDEDILAWRADAPEFATQSQAGTERR